MQREYFQTSEKNGKNLILGTFYPGVCQLSEGDFLEEFISLINTLGIDYDITLQSKLRKIDNAFFLTKGKLEELVKSCETNKIEHIICAMYLTTLQKRNLEDRTQCTVMDRNDLILEIFKKAAVTAEGKIQVKNGRNRTNEKPNGRHGGVFGATAGWYRF